MFNFDEKDFELKYSANRLELIEKATGQSVMGNLASNNAMLSLADTKTFFAYGLRNVETGQYVAPSQGAKYAEEQLEKGYTSMIEAIVEAIERDCDFLFLTA